MEYNWLEGFSVATKIYFRLGHLDIKKNMVTKGGFPIGAWLQWCRDNVDKLSLFEINDLCNYGMIWNNESLGNHSEFNKNYERLKKYGRAYIINLDNIEEEDLKEWALSLFELRKLCDDAFLTLREIEMLTDIGFDWGSSWPQRTTEVSLRKDKVSYLLDKIRKYNSTRKLPDDKDWKKSESKNGLNTKQKVADNGDAENGNDTYSLLTKAYIRQIASRDAMKAYRHKMLQIGSLNTREVRLLRALNDGRAGISKVFVPSLEVESSMPLITALKELEDYQEILSVMKGIYWNKSDVSLSGYSIVTLVCRVLLELEVNVKLENVYNFEINMNRNIHLVNDILIPYMDRGYEDRNILSFIRNVFSIDSQSDTIMFEVKKFVDKFRRTRIESIKRASESRRIKEKSERNLKEFRDERQKKIEALKMLKQDEKDQQVKKEQQIDEQEQEKESEQNQEQEQEKESEQTKGGLDETQCTEEFENCKGTDINIEEIVEEGSRKEVGGMEPLNNPDMQQEELEKLDDKSPVVYSKEMDKELDPALTNSKTFNGLVGRYKSRSRLHGRYIWQKDEVYGEEKLIDRLWALKDYLTIAQKDRLANAGFIYYEGELDSTVSKLQILFYNVNKFLDETRVLYVKNVDIRIAIRNYKSEKDEVKKDLMLTSIYWMMCDNLNELKPLEDSIKQLRGNAKYKYACDMIVKVVKNKLIKKKISVDI